MTVVLGVMANAIRSANSAQPSTATMMVCADTMASYSAGGVTVASAQTHGKLYQLAHDFCAVFCDSYSWSHKIICELNHRLATLDFADDRIRTMVELEVKESFKWAFLWMRGDILQQIGLTVDEYLHDAALDQHLRDEATSRLTEEWQNIPAEFILAGQTHMGPIFLKANSQGTEHSTEYLVSGGPQESALNWLKMRQQHNQLSVQRSFYHMMEAKWFAQQDPNVGPYTQGAILFADRTEILSARGALLQTWNAEFGVKGTNILDSAERRVSLETNYNISLTPA